MRERERLRAWVYVHTSVNEWNGVLENGGKRDGGNGREKRNFAYKGLTIQKKKKEKTILLAMTKRERTYQREGDVDDLIKKNIIKIYTLAVIIRDLNCKILRENYKKKKTKG